MRSHSWTRSWALRCCRRLSQPANRLMPCSLHCHQQPSQSRTRSQLPVRLLRRHRLLPARRVPIHEAKSLHLSLIICLWVRFRCLPSLQWACRCLCQTSLRWCHALKQSARHLLVPCRPRKRAALQTPRHRQHHHQHRRHRRRHRQRPATRPVPQHLGLCSASSPLWTAGGCCTRPRSTSTRSGAGERMPELRTWASESIS